MTRGCFHLLESDWISSRGESMKQLLIPLLLALTGCTTATNTESFIMNSGDLQDSTNVLEVPVIVRTGDELKIRIFIGFGGCEEFKYLESRRATDKLELTPIGNRQLNVACTAIYGTKWVDFVDAATPARSSRFKVILHRGNGVDLEQIVAVMP
jgi:hypothetical protein